MRKFRLRTLRWLALFLFLGLFAAIVLRWISLERLRGSMLQSSAPMIVPTPASSLPVPTATRPPPIGGKLDTAKLWSGITVHAQVDPTPGAGFGRADGPAKLHD